MIELIQDYADLLAVPFFGLLIFYFITKKNRNIMENILLLFACIGFLFDLSMIVKIVLKTKSKKQKNNENKENQTIKNGEE